MPSGSGAQAREIAGALSRARTSAAHLLNGPFWNGPSDLAILAWRAQAANSPSISSIPSDYRRRPSAGVNRWPRHASLTSKDDCAHLVAITAHRRCRRGILFRSRSRCPILPLKGDPSLSPSWQAFVDAHRRVGRGVTRVDGEQAAPTCGCSTNKWLGR